MLTLEVRSPTPLVVLDPETTVPQVVPKVLEMEKQRFGTESGSSLMQEATYQAVLSQKLRRFDAGMVLELAAIGKGLAAALVAVAEAQYLELAAERIRLAAAAGTELIQGSELQH